jgi:hypothetical protein
MFSKICDLADRFAAGISQSSIQSGRRSFLRSMLEASGAVAAFLGFAQLARAQQPTCVVDNAACTIGGVACTAMGVAVNPKSAEARARADIFNKCLTFCNNRDSCKPGTRCCVNDKTANALNCVTVNGVTTCTANGIRCWCRCYPANGMQCTAQVPGAG